MTSLLEIAEQSEKITVSGVELEVFGVSAREIAHLMGRFPALRQMMTGQGLDDLAAITKLAPDAIAVIIAAGIRKLGDAAEEAAADRLPAEAQLDIIAAIMRLTMPGGIGPFAERIAAAVGGVRPVAAVAPSTAPVTPSPRPSKR